MIFTLCRLKRVSSTSVNRVDVGIGESAYVMRNNRGEMLPFGRYQANRTK